MDRGIKMVSGILKNKGSVLLRYTPIAVAALLLFAVVGCDTIFGDISGEVTPNVAPTVEFSNVPADQDTFSYAPVIYWKGSDPDGFVEYYLYADIIDSTALADPEYFIDFIPEWKWEQNSATSDTVYLLTESGEITEHVFYLKCVDDLGLESNIEYRTFFRTNHPPEVPQVKLTSANDESFANTVVLADTFYVLENVTDTWPGISFNWKSSDPDDRDLYTIPLEYRYYLEKVPHDTVWQWASQDWSNDQEILIHDLESGHYTLSIWARDDGFEMSTRPASISFNVYKPTFEKSILLLDCTSFLNPNASEGMGNIVPGSQVGEKYQEMTATLGALYPDWEYVHYTDLDNLYKSYLGQYRLIIWFTENLSNSGVNSGNEVNFENSIRQYVHVGGRLWVQGNFLQRNLISNSTLGLAGSTFGAIATYVPNTPAEFVSARSGVSDLPDIAIDTSVTMNVYREFFRGTYGVEPLLPGIDILATGNDAETAYYFISYTDTASGDVWNDTAKVAVNVDTLYYPATPTDCLLKLKKKRVRSVSRIFNSTRNQYGEVVSITNNVGRDNTTVVRVSYASGEPWDPNDIVVVDYEFLPYSEAHYRPCALRYERLEQVGSQGGYEVRYRIAVFSFPLYYMDNSDNAVTKLYASMLNWFFLPYAH